MSKILRRIFVVAACAAAAAFGQTAPPIFPVVVHTSGMVGLTAGQTARLNVLNPGVLPPAATGATCTAQLTFLNDQGAVLKTMPVTVLPGKSVSFNLDRDVDVSVANERFEIRATIGYPALTPATTAAPLTCALLPTLEIFNNDTGRTQFVVGHFARVTLTATGTP